MLARLFQEFANLISPMFLLHQWFARNDHPLSFARAPIRSPGIGILVQQGKGVVVILSVGRSPVNVAVRQGLDAPYERTARIGG